MKGGGIRLVSRAFYKSVKKGKKKWTALRQKGEIFENHWFREGKKIG